MSLSTANRRILAYRSPVDMRKSFDGLLSVVQRELGEDPLSETMFVFMNRRCNLLKLIYWDRTGYALYSKRLERGQFQLPSSSEKQELSECIFKLVLDGIPLGSRRGIM